MTRQAMVEINVTYEGGLHCVAVHGPSGTEIPTDAPVDNQGKGETFSPTDLVATALATCMVTIMGIVARRKELPIEGTKVRVGKEMSADMPRRIARLELRIEVPLAADHPAKDALINAAMTCPVHQSLHPDIEVPIEWLWNG